MFLEPATSVEPSPQRDRPLILLTGATGYVGGRLLARLEGEGHRVRCLTRRPDELKTRAGANTVVVQADMLDTASLAAAAELPGTDSKVYEIGGTDQVSFGQLMQAYARQRGLRRRIIPVPFLTPRLSSLWLGLVTPVYARVGRKLIESMTVPTVVRDQAALEDFSIRPQGVEDAIARAIVNEDMQYAATRWFDALSSSGDTRDMSSARFGSRLVDSRTIRVAAAPGDAFTPISRIGGRNGWYYGTWLWHVRGFLDLLVGGVGMRRGRLDPTRFQVGEAVDWWRVEAIEPGERVRLFAEMKVPGRAWLEFEVQLDGNGSSIRQTAIFDPVGLAGLAYWYVTYPVHQLMFRGMLKEIGRQAEAAALEANRSPVQSP
jgi:hypothetical protein